VVAAPLAVEDGLIDPHSFNGVQLQVTPPLALSFNTVATTIAVPLGAMLNDGGVDRTTEMLCNVVPVCELPPQPERNATMNITSTRDCRIMTISMLQKSQIII